MVKLSRKQREALNNLFIRKYPSNAELRSVDRLGLYRKFRRTVQPELAGYGAVMVPFAGMWVGIETDGYTHS